MLEFFFSEFRYPKNIYKYVPGAPKVLSGKFAGLLFTVAILHEACDFSVPFDQSHISRSNLHSPGRTLAPAGIAAMHQYTSIKYGGIQSQQDL